MKSCNEPLPPLTSAVAAGSRFKVNDDSKVGSGCNTVDEQQLTHQAVHSLALQSSTLSTQSNRAFTSPCFVSFTGFREEDEWHDEHGSENEGDGTKAVVDTNSSELEMYERLAQEAGVVVQPTFMSSTSVLVARRGFTKKRLLAAYRRIPVVHPRWIQEGCLFVSRAQVDGTSDEMDGSMRPHTIASIDASYAVPWLHGYVFSTTGLSTQEKAAIQKVCTEQHGAVVEASLTYRCDALLTSAECIRELQEVLRRDSLAILPNRTGTAKRQGGLRTRTETEAAAENSKSSNASHSDMGSWITDKIRFALEFDIPVVDYVRLFSLLRLDRLPSPSIGLISARKSVKTRATPEMKSKDGITATAAWPREIEEALNGNDFDSAVSVCRVAAPPGGASQWRLVLERAAQQMGKEGHQGKDDGACEEDQDREETHSKSSSNSSFSFSASSASTVSDPDVWEDFMQQALLPSWSGVNISNIPQQQQQQRIVVYPRCATAKDTRQPAELTLNTVDVEVQPTSAEPATLHVSMADYYSETEATNRMQRKRGTEADHGADSYNETSTREFTTLGASQVGLSPQLTTNALFQRDQLPRSSDKEGIDVATEFSKSDPQDDNISVRIAAYYAAHHDEEPSSSPSTSTSITPWGVPTGRQNVTATAVASIQPNALAVNADTQSTDMSPTTTQVLVESCTAADGSRGSTSSSTALKTRQTDQKQQLVPSSAVARVTLPLLALHPPYLTVSVLGCTEAEERRAKIWCGICRFLRSPVPTIETDVVVLGSRVLAHKKYVGPSRQIAQAHEQSGGCGGLRAAAVKTTSHRKHGEQKARSGGKAAVCVRYWEMDAVVARVLAETCGIAPSRIAPMQWLEDAAAATQKAVVGEAQAHETNSSHTAASARSTFSLAECDAQEMETTSSPQDTLEDLVHDRLEAVRKEHEERQQLLAMEATGAGPDDNSLFDPFPALLPEELPSLANPRYYIRLRRSFQPTVSTTKDNVHVLHANTTNTNTEAKLSPALPFQQQQQPSELKASESSVESPYSLVQTTLSSSKGDTLTTSHNSNLNSGSFSMWARSGSDLDVSAHCPASPSSPASLQGGEHSYDEELKTAGRRFNNLIALFTVEGHNTCIGAARCNNISEADDTRLRRRVLQSCCFCCVDGEYSRVDWAVLRALVRYGGGRVEKKTTDEWEQVLIRSKEAKEAQLHPSSKSRNKRFAGNESKGDDVEQRRLTARVRRNMDYDKQQRKLARLLLCTEVGGDNNSNLTSSRATDSKCLVSSVADTTLAHEHCENAVEQLRLKLASTVRQCQQAPVLCLLPHSFQRAPPVLQKQRTTSTRGPSGNTVALPPNSRLHVLHGLARVTQDYILACLAVGYCLNPLRCFLFYASIPSAPDARLLHPRIQKASQHQSQKPRLVDQKGQFGAAAATTKLLPNLPCRPMLSAWMREKRYSKPESVGVCVAFLWSLPSSNTKWVDTFNSINVGSQISSSVQSVSKAHTTDTENCVVPSAQLVPLIRVLLLGFRNAVEAMGGHVADVFVPASVTHAVLVDVASILSSSLKDMYTMEVATVEDSMEAVSTLPAATKETEDEEKKMDGGTEASNYWPAESLSEAVRCAAQQELSLVSLKWLASCVEWGTFIDETAFAPPDDIQARIRMSQQHLGNAQRRQHPQSSKALTTHTSSQRESRLTSQSIRHGSAAPTVEVRKRTRTPSPTPTFSSTHTETAPDASRATAAPHTPPRPSSSGRNYVEEGRRHPSLPSTFVHSTTYLADENILSHSIGDRNFDNHAHTPVMRRPLPPSGSNSNTNAEPGTPPPRPPAPRHHLSQPIPYRLCVDPKQSSPASSRLQGRGAPSVRSGSRSIPPLSSAGRRSSSGGAHRHRASLSASQHNTYSIAEQQDADAYVEHLSDMFNFCSPGSTPLPSSAKRGQQLSMTAIREADRTPPPPPDSFGIRLLHEVIDRTSCTTLSPDAAEKEGVAVVGGPLEALPPHHNTQMSHFEIQREASLGGVVSTPRRPTLRTHAAATASATRTCCCSPDRRCHRSDDSYSNPAVCTFNETQTTDNKQVSKGGKEGAVAASASANALSKTEDARTEKKCSVPVVLGSGSSLLSPRGTEHRSHIVLEHGSRKEVSHNGTTGLPPIEQAAVPNTVKASSQNSSTADRSTDDTEVWMARTQSLTSPNAPESQGAVCRFSGADPRAEDEATVPLPHPGEVALPTEHDHTEPEFCFLSTMIPDSQPDEMEARDARNEVLVPASFVAVTEDAYTAFTDSALEEKQVAAVEEEKVLKVRRSLELVGGEELFLTADEDGQSELAEQQQKRRAAADAFYRKTRTGHSAESLRRGVSRPRLGMRSVPRQPSPSRVPPAVRHGEAVVLDVDEDRSEEEAHELNTEASESAKDSSVPPLTSSKALQGPTASPWTTHRPLSLSLRTSRSPTPLPQVESTHDATIMRRKPAAATVSTKQYEKPRAEGPHSFCLHIYVLFDVPHRESRVQRCLEALREFTHDSHSSATATFAQVDSVNRRYSYNCSHSSSSLKLNSKKRERDFHDHETTATDDAPPICFVTRCEDADVCVTHEVNFRESVLVAVAVGCWVVQPGFLECVAAILEGCSRRSPSRQREQGTSSTSLQELNLLPHPCTSMALPKSAPSPRVVACYRRLCERCPTYEWTSAAVSASTNRVSPMHRSLVLQCRRQRQAAQARLLGHREHCGAGGTDAVGAQSTGNASGLSTVFAQHSFLFLSAPFSSLKVPTDDDVSAPRADAVRVSAICRLLSAGGGKVLSVVQMGCVKAPQPSTKHRELSKRTSEVRSPEHGLLRCCISNNSKEANAMSTTIDTPTRIQVTAEDLYHDLIHILCDAAYHQEWCDREADIQHNDQGHCLHCEQQSGISERTNSLIVLLDTSLFFPTGVEESTGKCCVVVTESHEKAADNGEVGQASQRPAQSREAKSGDTRVWPNTKNHAESTFLNTKATTPARPAISYPLGVWLVEWLAFSDVGEETTEEVSGYSEAVRHALRSHLSACCSIAHHAREMSCKETSNTNVSDEELRTAQSLSSVAEVRWLYKAYDIPFHVPTLEEVLCRFIPEEAREKNCSLYATAIAGVLKEKQSCARHMEFRSINWAGACVAAGGSSVLAAAAAAPAVDTSSQSLLGMQDDNAWMRECDTQTLLAVLPY